MRSGNLEGHSTDIRQTLTSETSHQEKRNFCTQTGVELHHTARSHFKCHGDLHYPTSLCFSLAPGNCLQLQCLRCRKVQLHLQPKMLFSHQSMYVSITPANTRVELLSHLSSVLLHLPTRSL